MNERDTTIKHLKKLLGRKGGQESKELAVVVVGRFKEEDVNVAKKMGETFESKRRS